MPILLTPWMYFVMIALSACLEVSAETSPFDGIWQGYMYHQGSDVGMPLTLEYRPAGFSGWMVRTNGDWRDSASVDSTRYVQWDSIAVTLHFLDLCFGKVLTLNPGGAGHLTGRYEFECINRERESLPVDASRMTAENP